jgi:multiple sugar transport system permease protein
MTTAVVPRRRARRAHAHDHQFWAVVRWASIAFFVVFAVFPTLVMVGLSFRPGAALMRTPAQILPSLAEFTLDTYARMLRSAEAGGFGFTGFIANSLLVAGSTVVVALVVGVFAAYAATRLRFRGAGTINVGIILVYLFPPLVFAVPLFVIFTKLGMRPSFVAVILIYLSSTMPLVIYMLRNYFRSIPGELEEAARIDGASRLRVIASIVLPLARPAIVTVGFYAFMSAWNEFMFALLFLVEDRDYWTVSLGIHQLEGNLGTPTTVLMAGCVIITVPLVIIFSFAQRSLAEGLTSGAVKD